MRRTAWIAPVLMLMLVPTSAWAQRGRNATAHSAYGNVFNPTQTPEWRQAGGNLEAYQAIMQQKMLVAQQKEIQQQYQAMLKQQQAFDKWVKEQKGKKEKGQPVDPRYEQLLAEEARYKAAVEAETARIAARKGKKRTTYSRPTSRSSAKSSTTKP